nr:lysophospholipid acyltransferase family protein [Paenarthrobacter sp. Z7-10]
MMGKEWLDLAKLPRDRGIIVCPNHCTEIDPVVVGHMLYNQNIMPHFLAKEGLFNTPIVGAALRHAMQIPVDRSGAGAGKSLEVARQVLDNGGAVIIYPEGTLTRDPDLWPMKGRTGAARLALLTGAPVIPVAHWGAQEAFPRYARWIRFFPRKRVRVLVGDPVDLSRYDGSKVDKATLEAATNLILDDITVLVAQLRGESPPAARWDPSVNQQTSHGRIIQGDDGGPGLGPNLPQDSAGPAAPAAPAGRAGPAGQTGEEQ